MAIRGVFFFLQDIERFPPQVSPSNPIRRQQDDLRYLHPILKRKLSFFIRIIVSAAQSFLQSNLLFFIKETGESYIRC